MKFGKLTVENFMSIREASTDFRDRGLVLIQGSNGDADSFESNGAGKSTLFSEAPTWALFGETIRGQKADKVVNRTAKKNTRVSQELIDDNGDVYLIIRHRKHNEHKNHVLLFRNDTNITGKSDTDTNIMIEDLIQMDYSTFTNSIMFGQGVSKMFSQSTDGEQKKILEKMLQIDIYKECQDLAKKYKDVTEKSIEKVESDIESNSKERKSLELTIEDLQTKESELEEKVKSKINELTIEQMGYSKELDNLPNVDNLQTEITTYESLRDKLDDRIASFKEYEDSRNDLVSDDRSLRRDIDASTRDIDQKVRELEDLQNNKNVPRTCKACGQGLPLNDTSHLENHLKDDMTELEKSIEEKEKELKEVSSLLTNINTFLSGKVSLESQYKEIQGIINDINTDIKLSNSRRKEIEKYILSIDTQIKEQEEMSVGIYAPLIESSIGRIDSIDEDINKLHDELMVLNKDLDHYNFWVHGYSNQGIKSVLLDSVTPFLNTRANQYLTKLTDSSIEVTFNTQVKLQSGEVREKFSVDVTNENGDNEYKGNSGGEKRRIDIAVNMALQDLVSSRSNKSIDLVVYDECFEGLDSVGCETVIELLQEKSKVFGTVLVITHNDNLKQLFSKSLVVSKNNGTTLVEDSA